MAFNTTALPSIAAATTEIWPSVANTIMMPFRGPTSRTTRTSSRPVQQAQRSSIEAKPEHATAVHQVELPDFLRDADLSKAAVPVGVRMSPISIHADIAAMSPRSLAAANPLMRSSFRALMSSKPLGTVRGLRAIHTYQPGRLPRISPWSSTLGPRQQYRGFGSGGISRSLLASREAAANSNPNSPTAQNAFYQVLLKANMPAIVIERYQSGRFASNEGADEAYSKAVQMLGGGVNTAGSLTGSSVANANMNGLTPSQIQAVSQALAAHSHGGNVAMARGAQGSGAGSKDGPIHVVVDESMGGIVFRWVKFVLWFCLFTYLSLVVVTMIIEALNSFKRPGATRDSEVKSETQTTRFDDVQGCDEAKEELQDLVEFLKNPEKFSTLGGKLPKGVLLVGPPGTGKTLLARAVAGEAGVPFFYMSGSEFDEVYVGVGAKRVRELFAAAKAKSPSIVFIDELDAIGGKRNARDAAYVKQTLNQLLTELDGFDQNSGVIIMGATNFPQLLDKALTRPGRFDRHVTVPIPDVRGRIAILKHHTKKIKSGPDVNLQSIALTTSGLSGAELENIVNQAAIRASKSKAQAVSHKDFEWAKDKVIMGSERRTMVITPKEKEMTAYHEAGHALVSYFTKDAPSTFYKVTILPRGQTLGHTARLPVMDKYSFSLRDYLSNIEVALGGKVAEEIVYGQDFVTSGVSSDLKAATGLAWQMVGQLGMSQKLGPMEYLQEYEKLSSQTKSMVESEIKKTLDDAYERTKQMLISKRKELDLVAKALVEYETLDKDEMERVMRGERLEERVSVPIGPMKVPKPADILEGGLPGLPPLPGGSDDNDGGRPSPPPPPPPGGMVAGREPPSSP
ncbi:P-loop containing nucleoside triphosphate hydrolase protein [Coniochaeta sp. 2T2.1]|nr:P-loop containing nucleoside triphosphate hydrolase protein [Coniochaeta sp. 2T2.1]